MIANTPMQVSSTGAGNITSNFKCHWRRLAPHWRPLAFQRSALASLLVAFHLSVLAEVTVKDAWVRGTVKGQTSSGAFLTLTSS
jgi:hypothetical protein